MVQIFETSPGVASGDSAVFSFSSAVSGEAPMSTINVNVADAAVATVALLLYSVVTFNMNNEIVMAALGDVIAGVVAGEVRAGTVGAKTDIYLGGIFNVDRLVYGPSFLTEDQKLNAFNDAGLLRAQKNKFAEITV